MLDIRLIREKPDFVRERLATRGGGDEAKIDEILREDAERRRKETELQQLQAERNRLSKEIGAKRSRRESADAFEERAEEIKKYIANYSAVRDLLDRTVGPLLEIPNLPHPSVPIGKDPSANSSVRAWIFSNRNARVR